MADEARFPILGVKKPVDDGSEAASRLEYKFSYAHRIKEAFLGVPRAMHLLLLLICLLLGFALVTQVRAQQHDPLESLDQEDLVVLLSELDARERDLRQESYELQKQLDEIKSAESEHEAAQEAARQTKQLADIIAGLLPVHGEGVQMTVADPIGSLTPAQFVMLLGELRNAGAEAIDLNGIRLNVRSSFTSDESGILLDGKRISSPYQWKVVGPARTIATALEIQAGAAAQMRAKNASVDVITTTDIVIDSIAQVFTPQWARIS
ncbi:DUF881 domain-containing protein [Schaalia sp. lx-260]|uniref:DUF881 domain-containing protein n=1 Tax=Schaalia sp. lx-260 TaxID=2899082 RepID=UPI001E373EA5|nr:DUF881 domain-containing protein [Schaalia sp. lx-260]MCD4549433.1 DUF881 domain-containing protein [Schaalia sp. lx-260]